MRMLRRIFCLAFTLGQGIVTQAFAAGMDDPFIALQTNVAGIFTYVRSAEIEAFADVSPSHCLLLFAGGKNVRAYQKCTAIMGESHKKSFAVFPSDFGNVFIYPPVIYELLWTGNSGCRVTLKSGKFVYAKQSCNEVHERLLRD